MNKLELVMNNFLNALSEGDIVLDTEQLSKDAFLATYKCKCVYAGSSDYFDTRMGQWYPGDSPEYNVEGYEGYIEYIVDNICDIITTMEPTISDTDNLKTIIKSNLENIMGCDFIKDFDEYEDKAIDRYLNTL